MPGLKPFSHVQRQENLKKVSDSTYDLVIVGGGINGAGIAREAAGRGLKVAVLEAKDFSIGSSSRSSKLIHGGIRYLENLEFHLVFEALSERAILFEMAPHLVHPLRFVLPIYKDSRVGYFKMGLGMWLYDLLSAFEAPEMHAGLSPKETVERISGINKKNLVGSFEYSDGYMDDDRLVHETLRSAHTWGAEVFNFCKVTQAHWASAKEGDRVQSLEFEDSLTGEKKTIHGKQFVGAVGPWTDIFGQAVAQSGKAQWKSRMRPTKGVHLTFSRNRIPIQKAVVMAVDQRIIFVIPRHEMVIVGTTDTDFEGDPYDVKVDKEDVVYILKALDQYFPEYHIKENDILASYAGVRPLVEDGSATEGKTSREHEIFSYGENLTFIGGGKYTTYRKIADDVLKEVLKKMSFERSMVFGKSRSKEAINPLATPASLERLRLQTAEIAKSHEVPMELVEKLVERHGEEAFEILSLMRSCEFSDAEESRWYAEAVFAIQNTCCLRLEDFYWRRSPLFLAEADHGRRFLNVVCKAFTDQLKWTESEIKKQLDDFEKTVAKELAWKL